MFSSDFILTLIAAAVLAVACALLSVFVVARRWALIGEGISHSGVAGAGTAWMLALVWPGVFDRDWVPYAAVVVACLVTALAIGLLIRAELAGSDAAIGIFLVGSLAWGFLAQQVYSHARNGVMPQGWDNLIFGQIQVLSPGFSIATIVVSLGVIAVMALLSKEIVYYCFDPSMAQTSGVSARLVHYLLMGMLGLTIVVGTRVAGSVLVTALLVLPGTTALLLRRQLASTLAIATVLGITGTTSGLLLNQTHRALPAGPAIVLVLLVLFVVVAVMKRTLARRVAAGN